MKNKFHNLVFDFWRIISRRRKIECILILFLMVITSLSEIISIGLILPFLSLITNPEYISTILNKIYINYGISISHEISFFGIIFIISIAISSSFKFILLWSSSKVSHGIGVDLSLMIYKELLYKDYEFHLRKNSSEYTNTIIVKSNILINSVSSLLAIFSSLIILISALIFLTIIDYKITFSIFIFFSLLYLIISLLVKKILINNSRVISQTSDSLMKFLQESFFSLKEITIHKLQPVYTTLFYNLDINLRKSQANNNTIIIFPRIFLELMATILIILFIINYGLDNELLGIIPVIGTVVLGIQRLLPVMQQLYSAWSSLEGSKGSLLDALEMMKDSSVANLSDSINLDVNALQSTPIDFNNNIFLNKVCYGYPGSEKQVINNFSFNIRKGSTVGVYGKTGRGKTTIIDLLLGLIIPTSGSISIDGIELNKTNIAIWQSQIAHVPQSIFLADTSIAQNIAFGTPIGLIDMERVRKAAEIAKIAEEVECLPSGYLTEVGERGLRFSGGQRQRIAIARALYRKCDLLILDEATSALDEVTEDSVIKSIRESMSNTCTIILISHRMKTINSCDQIINMDNFN
jgi:ABC-type bacteriocin/lantibiotic exporter with double-glycine peptidase domain